MSKVEIKIQDNGLAFLKMNDVDGKNIFSDDFIHDLLTGIDKIEEQRPKVMILQGLEDVFSGGADKETLMDLCDGKLRVKDLLISDRLINVNFPVISAMEGHAVGGGFVMAACSDIVLAAEESRYGVVFMSLGFTPGMGCTTLLQGLVGDFIANEMMFTGKRFKGSQLAKMNTNINYILPKNKIMKKAQDIALQICEKNVKSINLLKYALSARKKKLLVDARLQEDMMHQLSFGFPETKETIKELYAGE
jgi:polyketide biosynthesis enoyl-CoA hydratase PksI